MIRASSAADHLEFFFAGDSAGCAVRSRFAGIDAGGAVAADTAVAVDGTAGVVFPMIVALASFSSSFCRSSEISTLAVGNCDLVCTVRRTEGAINQQ